MIKTPLPLRPKNDISRLRASSWFPADLQSLLIWWLKFNSLSIWSPRSLTDEVDLIFSFLLLISMLELSVPRLSGRITWNLSGFTIILLLRSQLIAASHSDSDIAVILAKNYLSLIAKLAKALSSALLSSKLWTETFGIKKKSCWKKYYITLAQKLSLGVHLIWLCYTRFVHCIFEHIVYDLLNNNRCSKASHYLDHMLRVLRSISREICGQKL